MGRHSAPDDVGDGAVDAVDAAEPVDAEVAAPALDLGGGRHSRNDQPGTDATDQTHTQRIAVVDAPLLSGEQLGTEQLPTGPVPVLPPVQDDLDTGGSGGAKADKKAARAAQKADKAAAKAARKAERGAGGKQQRAESDTKADLRLLREQPAVRAQVIGAVIASFLVYTLVMIALGRSGSYLVWLWIPIVACGVLVGLVLDLAHRRQRRRNGPTG